MAFIRVSVVPLEQCGLTLSKVLSEILTDKDGSDDQQSRELHHGLFRGRSAGAGGVRSVVLHVTVHQVYTCRCTLFTETFLLIDIFTVDPLIYEDLNHANISLDKLAIDSGRSVPDPDSLQTLGSLAATRYIDSCLGDLPYRSLQELAIYPEEQESLYPGRNYI